MMVMRLLVPLLLALALLASPPATTASSAEEGAAVTFVPGTEDVPLMAGLTPLREGGLTFDKPEGRIVQAVAKGAVARMAVRRFYRASLHALGWTRIGADRWSREGERLKVDIRGHDGDLSIAFTLSPEPQSSN